MGYWARAGDTLEHRGTEGHEEHREGHGAQGHGCGMGHIRMWAWHGLRAMPRTVHLPYPCPLHSPPPLTCCGVPLGEPCLPRRGGGVTGRVL